MQMELRGKHRDQKLHFDDFLRVVTHYQKPLALDDEPPRTPEVNRLVLPADSRAATPDESVFGLPAVPEEMLPVGA